MEKNGHTVSLNGSGAVGQFSAGDVFTGHEQDCPPRYQQFPQTPGIGKVGKNRSVSKVTFHHKAIETPPEQGGDGFRIPKRKGHKSTGKISKNTIKDSLFAVYFQAQSFFHKDSFIAPLTLFLQAPYCIFGYDSAGGIKRAR
jgi:hypothetical protein